MKNDLILKLFITFLFPFFLTYSLISLSYAYLYDSITIITSFLILVIISIIYQLRFRRLSIVEVYKFVKLKSMILIIIFGYFFILLMNCISTNVIH